MRRELVGANTPCNQSFKHVLRNKLAAALGPTTTQHLAAILGGHAFSESVLSFPDNVGWCL